MSRADQLRSEIKRRYVDGEAMTDKPKTLFERMSEAQSMTARPVGDDLDARLREPKQWCCIFEHEGVMRHGTSDAPFKAADRITDLQARLERYRVGLVEAQLQLEYLDERFPTGTTPPIIARISKALDGGVEG